MSLNSKVLQAVGTSKTCTFDSINALKHSLRLHLPVVTYIAYIRWRWPRLSFCKSRGRNCEMFWMSTTPLAHIAPVYRRSVKGCHPRGLNILSVVCIQLSAKEWLFFSDTWKDGVWGVGGGGCPLWIAVFLSTHNWFWASSMLQLNMELSVYITPGGWLTCSSHEPTVSSIPLFCTLWYSYNSFSISGT